MKKYTSVFFVAFVFLPLFGMDGMPSFYKQFSYNNEDGELCKKRVALVDVSTEIPSEIYDVDPDAGCKILPINERPGVCFDFAMKKILVNHGMPHDFKIAGGQDWLQMLPCFKNTDKPRKGDLVAYFSVVSKEGDAGEWVEIYHYGCIAEPSPIRVESKWGETKAIFTHDLFSVPEYYGNHAVLLRLKRRYRYPGVWQNQMIGDIQKIERSKETQKRLKKLECSLLKQSATFLPEAEKRAYKIVSLLERYSALNVDCKDKKGGRTPLMFSATHENHLLVELLLLYGANPEESDYFGRTAKDIAEDSDNDEIKRLLLRQ